MKIVSKILRILLTLLLVLVLLLGIALGILCLSLLKVGVFAEAEPPAAAAEFTPITQEDFLHTEDTRLCNARGETVVLRGVNLGGWLMQEVWMNPIAAFPESPDEGDSINALYVLNKLEERFGEEKAQKLLSLYQDNWITRWDIENIAALGCNVIRVPFWYRNFMRTPTGDWLAENPDDNPGFQKLDWVIETAGQCGLYVILDMHGCPGGQSTSQCSGSSALELYSVPEYQDALEELWIAIARRYRGEPAVAAYDLINEPEKPDPNADASTDIRNQIYDRLYRAVRQEDPEHIITMEAIWNIRALPTPEQIGWENVMYQFHFYGSSSLDALDTIVQYSERHKVPIYAGEFMDNAVRDACEEQGFSFTSWTYKGIAWDIPKVQSCDPNWFCYYVPYCLPALPDTDPYWLLELKWGECLSTRYFTPNEYHLSRWQS